MNNVVISKMVRNSDSFLFYILKLLFSHTSLCIISQIYFYLHADIQLYWRREWQPTPVFLPGKSHRWRNLAGYSPWGHRESDTTEQLALKFLSLFVPLPLEPKWIGRASQLTSGFNSKQQASASHPTHHQSGQLWGPAWEETGFCEVK